jgi:hypothetical protein
VISFLILSARFWYRCKVNVLYIFVSENPLWKFSTKFFSQQKYIKFFFTTIPELCRLDKTWAHSDFIKKSGRLFIFI